MTAKIYTTFAAMLLVCLTAPVDASLIGSGSFEGRIGYGLDSAPPTPDGRVNFFDAGTFTQGDVSHTNTVKFDDGTVEAELLMTVAGFDSNDQPAPLRANQRATYVELGVGDNYLNSGEYIKVTFDVISFNEKIPFPMGEIIDPATTEAILSSIAVSAFHDNNSNAALNDEVEYRFNGVVKAATPSGQGTRFLDVPDEILSDGDMFEIEATKGTSRLLLSSKAFNYNIIPDPNQNDIPEPSTIVLVGMTLVGIGAARRLMA